MRRRLGKRCSDEERARVIPTIKLRPSERVFNVRFGDRWPGGNVQGTVIAVDGKTAVEFLLGQRVDLHEVTVGEELPEHNAQRWRAVYCGKRSKHLMAVVGFVEEVRRGS